MHMKQLVLVFVLVLLPLAAQAQQAKKHVLFLNSYENGYAWSDNVLDGVRQTMRHSPTPIDLQIEYMDTKRYRLADVREVLKSYYRQKYENTSFDLIICSDTNAFNFILDTRAALFPGVPVVFCGVNDFRSQWIENQTDITGVIERPDIASNILLAMHLRPQARRVIIIGDESVTSRAIVNEVKAVEPQFADRIRFEYWHAFNMQEILDRVSTLGDDAVVYFTPFYKGAHGELFTVQEVLQAVSERSSTMVFSSWHFMLGFGMVGGKVLSGFETGRAATLMGLRILDGTDPDDIPVQSEIPQSYVFDWEVLKRFNIATQSLPEGSLLINEPEAFYRINPQLFWLGLVFMISLSVILVFLVMAIAQRRKVEAEIKAQLAFQEILMDTIPLLVSWKDTQHRYLGVNKSFSDFFGPPDHETNTTPTKAALPPQMVEWEREVIGTGRPLKGRSITATSPDGSTVWLEICKVPLRGVRGEIVGTLSTAEDVTHKVELKQQLLQSQKMEAIGTLAGGIAHDFNNILTSIINSCELALMDISEGSQTHEDIHRALVAAQRGGRVVKQILTFSRPSQEGFTATDVGEVIREVMDLLRSSLPRTIEVRTRIEPTAPVWANPDQIHQAVMNLCTNAFQELRAKGGKLTVSLREEDVDEVTAQLAAIGPGRHLCLSVADNGPGIAADIVDKIFDPFFTTKGTAEGTGLGLAVVHGIVKAHSGGIRVSSRPYRRTAFDIYLPCRIDPATEASAAAPQAIKGTERILFVEDDPDQLETVPRLLADLGYRTKTAPGGHEALEMLLKSGSRFDLVITDFDMPGMDGLSLSREIARLDPAMPVIMVSGRRNAAQRTSEVPSIRQMVIKPYSRNVLAAAIRAALEDNAPFAGSTEEV